MTDPPPKKVGSLRDRIAAFENKGSAPGPAPAPVPRPKPAHVTWQPKPASPPASPKHETDDGERRGPGMSAADAKESIGKLSLRERMAALQGSAAFGGGAPAQPPPRPTGEKPKWKPPPVVQRVEPIGGEDEDDDEDKKGKERVKEDEEARSPPAGEEAEGGGEVQEKGEDEPDPEEEERQRRAALAAKMARLGGARVGMGPPIFGKKPDIPPKKIPSKDAREEETKAEPKDEVKPAEESAKPQDEETGPTEVEVSPTVQKAAAVELPPSTTEDGTLALSADYFAAAAPAKKDSASSTLSPESAASPPVRSPAMPVPLPPKRAAPPRKRTARSPAPAQPVVEQESHGSPSSLPPKEDASTAEKPEEPAAAESATEAVPQGDREPKVTERQVEKVVEDVDASQTAKEEESATVSETAAPGLRDIDEPESEFTSADLAAQAQAAPEDLTAEESRHEPPHKEESVAETIAEKDEPQTEEPSAGPEITAEPEEEEEAARRKRIAERLAKSGGFNPFAGGQPPPILRRDSADSARSPPLVTRRDSTDSTRSPPPPARRDSQQESGVRSPPPLPTSPRPEVPERKASVGSVQSGRDVPSRKSSLDVDGGVSDEPHPRAHAVEQSEPIAEEPEVEDEATPARVAHKVGESLADDQDEDGYDYAAERDDDHLARETKEEEHESAVEEADELVVEPHPPPPDRRPLPTPPAASREVDEEVALSPPPRRNFPPPPPRAAVPPPPPVHNDAEEQRAPTPEVDEAEDEYARHARELDSESEFEEDGHAVHEEEEREHAYWSSNREDATHEHEELVIAARQPPHFVPPPPPRHAPVPPPPPPMEEVEEEEEEQEPDEPAPPPPPRRPSAGLPPPPSRARPQAEDDAEDEISETAEVEDKGEQATPAPLPPPRRPSAGLPLPRADLSDSEDEWIQEVEPANNEETDSYVPPRHTRPISQTPTKKFEASAVNQPALHPMSPSQLQEIEILEDNDVDPIDPEFYSPQKSPGPGSLHVPSPISSPPPPPARVISPPPPPPPQRIVSPPPPQRVVSPSLVPERAASPPSATSPPPPPISARPHVAPPAPEPEESKGEDQDQEDAEQARRRTIAERMAKLGGIRFGAPPPVPGVRRPVPPPEPESEREEEQKLAESEEAPPPEEEEDEFARKQRIAARIAGMGGMRFGMMPGAPPPKPPPRVHREEEEETAVSPPPPKRSAPVPPPPPPPPAADEEQDHGEESDYQHVSDSDRAGHEESELEEVTYTDAEEEAPPPVPDRSARRASNASGPSPTATHSLASPPPIPRTRPPAPPAFTYPPPPHAPPPPSTQETQGDFVLVDQAESTDEPPPPPPPRTARPPPRAPPRAPPQGLEGDSASLPNIDFGGETDLSLSGQWSEDSTTYPAASPVKLSASAAPEQPMPPARSAPPQAEQHLTPDELTAHWGRVGVQVHEISAALYDKSKKSVVGDGSYLGFVHAVLSQVPNAAQPPSDTLDAFGYLVYSQSVGAVHRRVSDIMPGDVIVVSEAKFKGHKGLQSYNQSAGVGEPLVGIIGDFETKKSKVKVYQANQHVGQQSVESVSYRLEDLKSGSVKIYRVLEA